MGIRQVDQFANDFKTRDPFRGETLRLLSVLTVVHAALLLRRIKDDRHLVFGITSVGSGMGPMEAPVKGCY